MSEKVELDDSGVEPIAVIGMSCRLPGGVENPADFWRLLCDGVDPISDVPADRWNLKANFDADRSRKGKTYARQAGFLSRFDEFDAPFFGISRREAECMDPQQRWLLEAAWEAFEDAGLPPESLAGSLTGVMIGLFVRDFETLQLSSVNRDLIDAHTGVGTSMGIAANRVSYVYDLQGPSLTIDTACSSAMVALHYACQSLRSGECDLALAGGVNALLRAEMTIATSKASMLSVDARSKSFDAAANGYVRSEGVGLVVLKPLAKAIADGDPVVAVIRGSAVNQDGRSKGLTVPSGAAQEKALWAALRMANVAPASVQYVEAHGTGTPVGDPIESTALGRVLGTGRPAGENLIMGSVKSNLGHTESAAGVVSLIKVALALKNRSIPPNLHFKNPNPNIAFDSLQLQVPTVETPWPHPGDGVRRAVINSFGFGGTNGSMVVEEAPVGALEPVSAPPPGLRFLLPLSGKSPEALRAVIERMRDFQTRSSASLADICYSASLRRGHLNHRAAAVVDSRESLEEALEGLLAGELLSGIVTGEVEDTKAQIVFVFSGMGPQWWAMGRQLLAEEPVFREPIETVDALFGELSGWSILEQLTALESQSRIDETCVAQPAIFAVQVGLAALWQSWGVVPAAIVGHSVGEVAAAYVSGALTLPDAVKVIYTRSRLQQTTAGTGTMLAVGLSREAAEQEIAALADLVSIGGINSPRAITLAGNAEALRTIAARLADRGEFQRFLQVEVPYHSPGMDPIRAEMLSSLATLRSQATSVPLYSTVTGALIDGRRLDAEYWWMNVRYPVLFADAIGLLAAAGFRHFLELGPHPVLSRNIDECLRTQYPGTAIFSSLRRHEPERATLLASAGALHCVGYPLRWQAFNSGRFVRLPDYPWQRERYWAETEESAAQRIGNGLGASRGSGALGPEEHPLLGGRLQLAPISRAWESEIDLVRFPFLADHRIQKAVVYPGAAYAEMAMAAAGVRAVHGLQFHGALFLDENPSRVQLSLSGTEFHIHSEREGVWHLHATGQVSFDAVPECIASRPEFTPEVELDRASVYEQFARLGLRYGPAFQGIERLFLGKGRVRSTLTETVPNDGYLLHPTLLDASFQTLIGTVLREQQRGVYLPTGIGSIELGEAIQPGVPLECFAQLHQRTEEEISGDIEVFQAESRVLAVRALRCLFQPHPRQEQAYDSLLYRHRWDDQAPPAPAVTPVAGTWLIVGDAEGLGVLLENQLSAAGANVFHVAGAGPKSMREILASLPAGSGLDHIVHMTALDLEPAGAAVSQTPGCLSLMELAQALGGRSPRLWLVTRGAQSVAGEDVNMNQAAVWGMARVVVQEHPELGCTRLDLDPLAAPDAALLLAEMRSRATEAQVAWRQGRRYVLRLDRFTPRPVAAPAEISPEGTYLITGGTGGLGIVFARHLLARGARHLVLTARSGGAGKEAVLEELRRDGAEVRAIAADIGNPEQVRRLIAEIDAEMPRLRGVLHCAAVIDDGVLRQQTAERFAAVWKPKAEGAWWLHQVLGNRPLDHFVLFSSVASLIGSAGQAIYSSANAFLDGLAQHRRANGLTGLSINWGPWADVGAATKGDILDRLAERGLAGLDPAACLAAYDELIGQPVAQVGVCAVEWDKFFKNFPGAGDSFYLPLAVHTSPSSGGEGNFLEQLMSLDMDQRDAGLRRFLREELARALRLKSPDHVKPRQRLFDLGMDSLTSVELGSRMQAVLGIRLPSTALFDFPTVEALGNYLVDAVFGSVTADEPPPAEVQGAFDSGDVSVNMEIEQDEIASLLRLELAGGMQGKLS